MHGDPRDTHVRTHPSPSRRSSDLAPASPLPPAIETAIGGKNAYVITPEGNDLYTLHVRRSKGLPETFTGLSEPQALIYVREKLRGFVGFHGAPATGPSIQSTMRPLLRAPAPPPVCSCFPRPGWCAAPLRHR